MADSFHAGMFVWHVSFKASKKFTMKYDTKEPESFVGGNRNCGWDKALCVLRKEVSGKALSAFQSEFTWGWRVQTPYNQRGPLTLPPSFFLLRERLKFTGQKFATRLHGATLTIEQHLWRCQRGNCPPGVNFIACYCFPSMTSQPWFSFEFSSQGVVRHNPPEDLFSNSF